MRSHFLPRLAPIILALLSLGLLSRPASAATLGVPSQYATVQAAVNAAQNGDTVLIADGTYTGPGNVDIDFGGKNLTVTSQNGAATTIIDCQGSSSANHRGFYLHSGEANAVISGLTIENGYEGPNGSGRGDGGGILASSAGLMIQNCILENNTAISGGGLYAGYAYNTPSAPFAVTNCAIIGNTAQYGGSGIYGGNFNGTSFAVTNCTLTGNGTGPDSSAVENASYPSAVGAIALVNDVLYGDAGAEIANEGNGSANATATYSDIQGGYAGASNIVNADPQFAGGPANLHLKTSSPCLGAGTLPAHPLKHLTDEHGPAPPV